MTIDTSREAVERLLDGVTRGPWVAGEHQWPDQIGCCPLVGRPFSAHKNMINVAAANTKADIHFIAASRDLVPAILAERDAALAEVARLSTPPDDAEVLLLLDRATEIDPLLEVDFDTQRDVEQNPYGAREAIETALHLIRDQAAMIARLSHAIAAETAKREALEAALNYIENTESELGITLGCGDTARAALATPAPDAVQEAARVLLDALGRAQIDMTILKMFYNGEPNTALRAIAGDRT